MKITKKRILNGFLFVIFMAGTWFGLDAETLVIHKFIQTMLFICVFYQHSLISKLFWELKKQTITIKALLNCSTANFADRIIQNLKKQTSKE